MLITEAYAQTAPATGGGPSFFDPTLLMMLAIFAVFYFLLIRPQNQARKKLQQAVAALKKGDIVVTSGGLIGKVRSIDADEVRLELSPNVEVRVVRHAIGEVRTKSDPAPANDVKPAAAE